MDSELIYVVVQRNLAGKFDIALSSTKKCVKLAKNQLGTINVRVFQSARVNKPSIGVIFPVASFDRFHAFDQIEFDQI